MRWIAFALCYVGLSGCVSTRTSLVVSAEHQAAPDTVGRVEYRIEQDYRR